MHRIIAQLKLAGLLLREPGSQRVQLGARLTRFAENILMHGHLGSAYGLMTMIQNIGLAGFNLLIGWANDTSMASAANPGGYALGMIIFSFLGFAGLLFSWLLRRNETGPVAHGPETIPAGSRDEHLTVT